MGGEGEGVKGRQGEARGRGREAKERKMAGGGGGQRKGKGQGGRERVNDQSPSVLRRGARTSLYSNDGFQKRKSSEQNPPLQWPQPCRRAHLT